MPSVAITHVFASGLLLIDKPSGLTSFDCVHTIQRILGQRRVGHCGTLDPIAQGVLIILFGESTKRQSEFLKMDKQYWFRAELGRRTDSGDRTGRCVESRPYADVTLSGLQKAADSLIGGSWQVPPRISAIKYRGRPLYEWARRGVNVPRPPRRVHIEQIQIVSMEGAFWEGRVVCSRGTYVRSLVEDLATALGTVSTLDALVRERIGAYRREEALSWDRVCSASREELIAMSHGN